MIKDLFHKNRPIYSLEVFPPKKDADVSVIYDALEAGNLLMYDTLSTPRNVEAATIVTIKANSLTLTLSNPA